MNNTESKRVYPVYILSRVANEIFHECQKAVPHETLGRLLGYRLQWQGTEYTKIVDWVSGSMEASSVHACFTPEGTRECEFFMDERYGNTMERPKEVGLFHSHPFGTEPYFSSTDYETFLTFPYDQKGNAFILIDPISFYFKVFTIIDPTSQKSLTQVPCIFYTTFCKQENTGRMI